jgi:hypothetical protein
MPETLAQRALLKTFEAVFEQKLQIAASVRAPVSRPVVPCTVLSSPESSSRRRIVADGVIKDVVTKVLVRNQIIVHSQLQKKQPRSNIGIAVVWNPV